MNGLPYVPFYTSDFLGGTSGLNATEKGVYITLLALMYESELPLNQSWSVLARSCGCTLAAFKKALETLQEDGKMTLSESGIWSDKCDRHIEFRRERRKKATNAAKKRWQKTQQKQGQADANASPQQCQPEPEPEPDNTTLNSVVTARAGDLDLDEIGKKIRQAAGLQNDPSPSLIVMSEPINWIENGCHLELDILPTIKARAQGRRISNWSYFTNAVFEARDKRLAPPPDPGTTVHHRTETPNLATIALKAATR